MQEPYWWYVLFVKSHTEHKVVASFQKAYEKKDMPYDLTIFCPESEKYYKDKSARVLGKTYQRRPLFPGYVFVETNMPSNLFRITVYDIVYNSSDIIRLLTYGGSDEIAIKQEERIRLEYLLKGKRCVEHSIGYIEGDQIKITGGPLMGLEGSIKKINRHHRVAQIEIDMFNQKQIIEVALEIVSKQKGVKSE